MKKTVLSRRLVKARAAMLEKTLSEISDAVGYASGSNYLYRMLGQENIHLSTVNRIAAALNCSAREILEEIEVEEGPTEEDDESAGQDGRPVAPPAKRRANGHAARPEPLSSFTAFASEESLAREWLTPEEDEAWANL